MFCLFLINKISFKFSLTFSNEYIHCIQKYTSINLFDIHITKAKTFVFIPNISRKGLIFLF